MRLSCPLRRRRCSGWWWRLRPALRREIRRGARIDDSEDRVVILDNRSIAHHGDRVWGVDGDLIARRLKYRPQEFAIICAPIEPGYARRPEADVRMQAVDVAIDIAALYGADPALV
ncbi:MAG: hypothetical protein CM15mP74_07300 [Halieaceae bacterium]|nr:MAG: hypothetical protein CM15mP74_07300 [Halieaceae bacterium]